MIALRFPRRFLRASVVRVAMTVMALASGVALVCALDLVNRAVLRAFVEVVDTMAGRATLQVSLEESGSFPEALTAQVGAVEGVRQVIPIVAATAFTVTDPPESITVQAFDVTDLEAVNVYRSDDDRQPLVSDPLVFLNQQDSLIITRQLAGRLRLGEGDRLALDTAAGRRVFTVRGLIDPQGIGRAFGGNLVLMDLHAAQSVFTRAGMINRIDIVTGAGAGVADIARRIRDVLPAGLQVDTVAQRKADLAAVMRAMQVLLRAVGLIALGAAFIIAFNRLSAVFEERTWQLGVLRAVGVSRASVWTELVKEGLLLGVAGVALGIPAGVLIGRALLPLVATTTALNFRTVAPAGELAVSGGALALAAALGIGAGLAAAVVPAWRASGVSAAETIRGRGLDLSRDSGGYRWLACAVGAAAAAGALALQQATRDPTWGLIASALLVVSTAIMARPLVQALRERLLPPLLPWLGPTGRFAARGLSRNLRRTSLAVAMVAVGLGMVMWLAMVAFSFELSAVRVFEQAMRADFVVSSSHVGSGALEMPVDDGFAAALRRVDGVAGVVGVRLANWRHGGESIVLDAFDPEYFLNPSYGVWPLHGERIENAWQAVAEGRAVVVSSNFVQNLGGRVGDLLMLATPRGPLELVIAGVTTDFASPKGTIEVSRELYKQHWDDAKVTRFFVQGAPGTDRAALRSRLERRLAEIGGAWRVISSGELVAYWGTQIRRAFASLYALAGVILVVILFGIADNLSASVGERTRDLGVLRAAGVDRKHLRRLVIAEAVVIAMLGLCLAFGEGLLIAALWVRTTIPYLLGWIVELHVPYGFLLVIVLSTVVSCAAAALLPGQRAARLEPATALREE
jgi:putative ABC transport system permease protein